MERSNYITIALAAGLFSAAGFTSNGWAQNLPSAPVEQGQSAQPGSPAPTEVKAGSSLASVLGDSKPLSAASARPINNPVNASVPPSGTTAGSPAPQNPNIPPDFNNGQPVSPNSVNNNAAPVPANAPNTGNPFPDMGSMPDMTFPDFGEPAMTGTPPSSGAPVNNAPAGGQPLAAGNPQGNIPPAAGMPANVNPNINNAVATGNPSIPPNNNPAAGAGNNPNVNPANNTQIPALSFPEDDLFGKELGFPDSSPTKAAVNATSSDPSEQILGVIDNQTFKEMADIERETALLALQLKKDRLLSEIQQARAAKRKIELEQLEKREEMTRNRVQWEMEQTKTKTKDNEKQKQLELQLQKALSELEMQKHEFASMQEKAKAELRLELNKTQGKKTEKEEDAKIASDEAEKIADFYQVIEIRGIGDELFAMLTYGDERSGNNKTIKAKEGTVLKSGFKVTKIDPDFVELKRGEDVVTIAFSEANKTQR